MNAPRFARELAFELQTSYNPRDPYELILVQQLVWAATQIATLIADVPDEPDAKWLRLYNAADRTFHRNHRLLHKAGLYAQPAAPEAAPATTIEPKAAEIEPTTPQPARASQSPGPWPPPLQPSPDGALTRRMRSLLTESDDPDALISEWVAQGILPAPPEAWRDAAQHRDDQQTTPSDLHADAA